VLFIITSFFLGVLLFKIHEAKQRLVHNTPLLLEEAVRINISHKSKKTYYATNYKYDPQSRKVGEYETRTARYPDTIFTYKRQIADPLTSAFNGLQTALLDLKQLRSNDIYIIYDSLLQEKNFRIKSIVGITASHYTKLNDWSCDTTSIPINLRTAFTNQGDYEDINYYAYMNYSFLSLWELMSKNILYILLICIILLTSLLTWLIHKTKKEVSSGITLLKNGNYRIKSILFNINEKVLISNDKKINLPTQLYELFLMFLKISDNKVSKKDIKLKFWPKNIDSTSNMTSAINRLNKILKDSNCGYTISTDPKNDEYYILIQNNSIII